MEDDGGNNFKVEEIVTMSKVAERSSKTYKCSFSLKVEKSGVAVVLFVKIQVTFKGFSLSKRISLGRIKTNQINQNPL